MQISELQEETQDLDWFALDITGAIGHFATGGYGSLPRSVASSLEDLKIVTFFFRNQFSFETSPIVNQTVESYVLLKSEEAKASYLEDYVKMASRGLFSFDYLRTGGRPRGYFQVAKPLTSLHVSSLPQEIQWILKKTVLDGVNFRSANEIEAEALQ